MSIPNYVFLRKRTYHYIRRIPDELQLAFGGKERIQKSLKTGDKAEALRRAGILNADVEKQFAAARGSLDLGLSLSEGFDWTMSDWRNVALWFEATLYDEDMMRRLPRFTGAILVDEVRRPKDHMSDQVTFRAHRDRYMGLQELTVVEYSRERIDFINSAIRPLGVSMPLASPYLLPFAAECQRAEIQFCLAFFKRDKGDRIDWVHPDTIPGRWKAAAPTPVPQVQIQASPQPEAIPQLVAGGSPLGHAIVGARAPVGKTLRDCRDQWIVLRSIAKKNINESYLDEMDNTVDSFESHSNISDIGLIDRKAIVSFRGNLVESGEYKYKTINKKISFITSLLAIGEGQAWVDNIPRGNFHLQGPADEERREPYSCSDLEKIFKNPVFSKGQLIALKKASSELQFWLPVISCTHGMISSEIIQLGPDTIVNYPGTDVMCFLVTNAGGRYIKELARRRYIPIRKEILDLGILDLVEHANREKWRTLWSSVDRENAEPKRVAGQFSSFWAGFNKHTLKIQDPDKTLYSFRHSFKDALRAYGASDTIQDALMGHAEAGTGRLYGTKKEPKPVPIHEVNEAIQGLDWNFLGQLKAPPIANRSI